MQLRREFLVGLGILVVLNVLFAFGAIGLLLRMSPAIERILKENVSSGEAADEMPRARNDYSLKRGAHTARLLFICKHAGLLQSQCPSWRIARRERLFESSVDLRLGRTTFSLIWFKRLFFHSISFLTILF